MNSSLAWELVFYTARVPDVVSMFKTCRDLWLLSKREQLWTILLRRNFPTHASVVPPGCQKEWFCDLYQFGAYFAIDSHIHLWPARCLYYAHFDVMGHNLVVMTARNHESFKNGLVWARKVGVNYVGIANRWAVKQNTEAFETFKSLLKTNPSEHSEFEFARDRQYFSRLPDDMNGALTKLKKYDDSPWDELVEWLHEHFEIEQIVIGPIACDFKGRLREGNILEVDDPDIPYHDMKCISTALCETALTYSVRTEEQEDWRNELLCQEVDMIFVSLNGEPIPFREPEDYGFASDCGIYDFEI